MFKSTIAFTALAFAALGENQQDTRPSSLLKEETMTIEYFPETNQATLVMEGESEELLQSVEIRNPLGTRIVELGAGNGPAVALAGYKVETTESSLQALIETYAEGIYDIRAQTSEGRYALGKAVLSHEVLPAPVVLYPTEGSRDVSTTFITGWFPDPEAERYRVNVEQGENDGITVQLPAGTSSFQVPEGVLAPGTKTHLEVGAIGKNGNTSMVEVFFTTSAPPRRRPVGQ